jgi:hypothetical protein
MTKEIEAYHLFSSSKVEDDVFIHKPIEKNRALVQGLSKVQPYVLLLQDKFVHGRLPIRLLLIVLVRHDLNLF